MDAGYESSNPFKALFNYQIEASDFDVKKAYDSIQLFRDMASMAAKAQGIVSLNYKLKGVLDENMQPVYPSLDGSGVLNVRKVKVMGLKILSIVSQKAGADSLKNPDIAGLDIKSSIKNNVITVERFKIKMAGFRLRVEGKANFDGQLQMKMRLGLPPLGIIGIPIRVSGTQENPIIKMGKKDTEEVKETEYKEQ
jgi:AsmA protein